MGLEKLKFDKVMSILQKNWFMVSVHPSSYALGKLPSTRESRLERKLTMKHKSMTQVMDCTLCNKLTSINKPSSLKHNRPFPNYLWPVIQSESWCSSFHMKISLCVKTNFHMKG